MKQNYAISITNISQIPDFNRHIEENLKIKIKKV